MPIETEIELLKYRRTKIVATLGPSSESEDKIERLIEAVDVLRLNMSHGTHESHRSAYERVRRAADKQKKPTAVLVDQSGPVNREHVLSDERMGILP